jgi:choline kinase
MKAIILAAGMGTRLHPYTTDTPKCLVNVNGKSIINNALEILEANGIKETIIVVGYLAGVIRESIGDQFGDMNISYVHNDLYEKTSTSYSTLLALQRLEPGEGLILIEGDVFFESSLFKALMHHPEKNVTVIEKYNPNLDGSFVTINNSEIVTDWIHKTQRTDSFNIQRSFKTVNLHKFHPEFIQGILLIKMKEWVESSGGNAPIESVFRDIVQNSSVPFYSFEVGDLKWFEIDTSEDLKIAEQIFSILN